MDIGFIGLGRMGANMVERLLLGKHRVVAFNRTEAKTRDVMTKGAEGAFTLADLPGYGYAQRSAAENAAFDRMLADYASTRETLKTIFFLLDLRREPGQVEKESVEYFERLNIEVILVGTKADKLGNNDIANARRKWSAFFNRSPELIIMTSASKNKGRDELMKIVGERL